MGCVHPATGPQIRWGTPPGSKLTFLNFWWASSKYFFVIELMTQRERQIPGPHFGSLPSMCPNPYSGSGEPNSYTEGEKWGQKKKLSETCFWTKKNDCRKNRSTFFFNIEKNFNRKIFCWVRKFFRDDDRKIFDIEKFSMTENFFPTIKFFGGIFPKTMFFRFLSDFLPETMFFIENNDFFGNHDFSIYSGSYMIFRISWFSINDLT